MALILQLETSGPCCSVALSYSGKLLSCKEQIGLNIHAAYITLFIEEVMKKAEYTLQDIDAVCLSMGPGSYTGLRIGTSTAKGLCYALDKPLITINTLESMTYGALSDTDCNILCPMIDARRMEVYTALYDRNLSEIKPPEALILNEKSFQEFLRNDKISFFGSGSEKFRDLFDHNNAVFLDQIKYPSSKYLTYKAFAKYKSENFTNISAFEPFYLKNVHITARKK